ncbi:MAG: fibronectin type III domain-containing protein [Oscillospiraceae bacterium]|nr:fibronectin type III domain-containing protein [Oscillospiraceae bacterium]
MPVAVAYEEAPPAEAQGFGENITDGSTDPPEDSPVASPGTTEPEPSPAPAFTAIAPSSLGPTGTPIPVGDLPFTYTGGISAYVWGEGTYYAILTSGGTLTPKNNFTADLFLVGAGHNGGSASSIQNSGLPGGDGGSSRTVMNRSFNTSPVTVTIGSSNGERTAIPALSLTTEGGAAGGAGGSGGTNLNTNGGAGGNGPFAFGGDAFPFNQAEFQFAGGGGGGAGYSTSFTPPDGTAGIGGVRGGGNGGRGSNQVSRPGDPGLSNTGGGGGGASQSRGNSNNPGGAGGSGVIIIRGTLETPPTIPASITVPASITYGQAFTVSWGASSSDGGTISSYILERQINGGAWTQIQSSAGTSRSETLTRDQADTVRYRVKARSASGMESDWRTSDTRSVINNHAPSNVPSFTTQPAAAVSSWEVPDLTWTWNPSTDADNDTISYIVERSVNGGAWAQVQNNTARTYTHTVSSPGDTTVAVRVLARDSRNADSAGYLTSGTVSVTHDVTPAAMSITASPYPEWTNGDVIITVAVEDTQSGLKSINVPAGLTTGQSTALSGTSAVIEFTAAENGTYIFEAYDNAGNVETQSFTVPNIDKGLPGIAYSTSVPPGEFTNGNVEIFLTVSNELSGLSTVTSSAGTENVSGNTVTKTFTVTENGIYAFTATNEAGGSFIKEITVTQIDLIDPVISMLPRVDQWTNASSVMLDVEASDDYSGVRHIQLPDGTILPGETLAAYEILGNGIYTAYAEDMAGNLTPVEVDYQWFDRTPPAISSVRFEPKDKNILRGLARFLNLEGFITNEHLSVTVEAGDTPEGSEGESGVRFIHYRVFNDNNVLVQNWTAAAYGEEIIIDYELSGYIELYAEDAAGNVSGAEPHNILIDTTPPAVTVRPSTTAWVNTDITLTVSMEDASSGLKSITPSSGAVIGETIALSGQYAEIPFTVVQNGTYTFEVADNAGNVAVASITVGNIDKEPPTITITSSASRTRNEAVLSVQMTDAASGLRRVAAPDGAKTDSSLILSGRSAEILFSVAQNGTYLFEVTDNAGNVGRESVAVSSVGSGNGGGSSSRPSSRPNSVVDTDPAVDDDIVEFVNDVLHDAYPTHTDMSSDTRTNTVIIRPRTIGAQEVFDIECVCCGKNQDCTCGCLDDFSETIGIINPTDISLSDTSFSNSSMAYEKLPVRDRTLLIINIIILALILLICSIAFIIYLYNRDEEDGKRENIDAYEH